MSEIFEEFEAQAREGGASFFTANAAAEARQIAEDEQLAFRLQSEETAREQALVEQEKKDRDFAMAVAAGSAPEVAAPAAVPSPKPPPLKKIEEDPDAALAREIENQEREELEKLREQERKDREFAEKLFGGTVATTAVTTAATTTPTKADPTDADVALALELADKLAAELSRELDDAALSSALAAEDEIESDAALARRLQQQEEEEERKRKESAKAAAALASSWHPPPFVPPVVRPGAHSGPVLTGATTASETRGELTLLLEGTPIKPRMVMDALDQMTRAASGNNVPVRLVIKDSLKERFVAAFDRIGKSRGKGKEGLAIGFHGTTGDRLHGIESKGLVVPDEKIVKHATDSGYYGNGCYLTPVAGYAMGYARGQLLFICAVLRGRVFHCKRRLDGGGCQSGFDSHEARDGGGEWVIFNSSQIFPIYACDVSGVTPSPGSYDSSGSSYGSGDDDDDGDDGSWD